MNDDDDLNKSSAVADKSSHGCVRLFVVRSMHCCDKVRFIIYNTEIKSSGYYSAVESTFKFSVTAKTAYI